MAGPTASRTVSGTLCIGVPPSAIVAVVAESASGQKDNDRRMPTLPNRSPPHIVAVVAYDGVVLGDLSTSCEISGLARARNGQTPYEVRVCLTAQPFQTPRTIPPRRASLTAEYSGVRPDGSRTHSNSAYVGSSNRLTS